MQPDGRPAMTVLREQDAPVSESEPAPPRRVWNTPGVRRNVLLCVVLAWALVITAVVFFRSGGNDPQAAVAPAPSPSASDAPLSVPEVYQTLLPSVVRIESTGGGSSAANAKSMATSATGTGVIVNASGTVLTANHVIDGARAITLTYADGTQSAATVAAADPKQDVATLTPAKLPETVVPAVLGGAPAIGATVVAIGNPLGLTATTTSGVVSGLDRRITGEGGPLTGLIQFDAAVNPGSSGGPLINDRGEVVGIVIALANPTDAGTFIGIGFAVPIGTALGSGAGDGQAPPL